METEDYFLRLNSGERQELLEAGAQHSGLATIILEKDYWVCQVLGLLFSLPGFGEHLVFKGGTSLSKVYRLIDRFSEDVDLSFHRGFLGFGAEQDPEAATGKEQLRRIEALQAACRDCVALKLLPALHAALEERLRDKSTWALELDPQDPQTILFQYPQAGGSRQSYIAPMIRIELGARSDHWPTQQRTISSYLAEVFERPLAMVSVRALAAERTFWEKATLLHAEAHRDLSKPMPQRYTRHYHDLARMATQPVAELALADATLRQRVVAHKSVYFRSAWARYDLAEPATFRLVPPRERLHEVERDHRNMEPMFFTPPPPIKEVLNTLADLESRIRASAASV